MTLPNDNADTPPEEKTADRLSLGFSDDFSDLSALTPIVPATERPQEKADPKPKAAKARKKTEAPSKTKAKRTAKPPAKTKSGSDKIAKAHGFTSREPVQPVLLKKRRRVQHDEPVDQLSIRGPVRVLNQFIDYCDAHQLSYWEALEKLVDEAD